MLRAKIQEDMYEAMKAKDAKRLNVVRTLLSQVKNVEIDTKKELSDEEVIAVVRKQVKALEDGIAMFEKGGRVDLVQANKEEIKLLAAYLPPAISDEELEAKVKAVMEAHKDITNAGQLMGMCIRELKDIAESGRIAGMVKKLTANN